MYADAARAKREGKSSTAQIRFGPKREKELNERSAFDRKREWEAGRGRHMRLSLGGETAASSEGSDRRAREQSAFDSKGEAEAGKERRHMRLRLGDETAASSKGSDRRARKQNTQPEYHSRGSTSIKLRRRRQELAVYERGNASTRSRSEQDQQAAIKEDDAAPGLSVLKLIEALADQMASIRQYEKIMFETPNAELRKAQRLVDWVNEGLLRQDVRAPRLRSLLRSTMGGPELWSNASTEHRSNYTQLRIKVQARHRASLQLYVPSSDALSAQKQASKPALGRTREHQEIEVNQNQSKKGKSLHETIDVDRDDDVPVSIPYTTAASVFLYGSNTVLAALRAQRRKLYNLYLHPRLSSREDNAEAIRKLAKQLKITTVDKPSLAFLDKVSEDRPHNGVVLEASRLPTPPLLSLSKPDRRTSVVPLVLDRQSAEDVHANGAPGALSTLTRTWRHPFVLMLDGIVDPGNVGNILRTAHFYGVDAVAVATNTCASLAVATLAKASSGACEALRIFALPRPADFVHDSVRAGWHAYAAVAAPSDRPKELWTRKELDRNTTTTEVARSSPLAKHPAILILGAEGEGLRENLKNKATQFVTIDQGPRASDNDQVGEKEDVGVDSLNVSVAAGVLVEAFMRRPEGAEDIDTFGELGF